MADGDSYASGNWLVTEGSEDEFVSRWTEFLRWTRENAQGFREAKLVRSVSDPRHFVSFAQWDDDSAQEGWRALPEFTAKFGACRELCDEMEGGALRRAVSI